MRLRARAGALIAATALAGQVLAPVPARAERILFVGDVLLARQVEDEVASRDSDPFRGVRELFASADWVAGNLEGAVGAPSACDPKLAASGTCFAVPAALLASARGAGFAALSLENNHRADLGDAGRARTRAAVAGAGMLPLTFEGSPAFVRVGGLDVAVIAVDRVPDIGGASHALPSVELARRLRLARALAQLTLVSVHWGRELMDWPDASQRAAASWLVDHGADVVLGHHPHVVQPAECVAGRPVFYSLGNHLFDQKYPETRRGRIADCRLQGERLRCGALATEAEARSTAPRLVGAEGEVEAALAGCAVPLRERLAVSGFALAAEPTPVRGEPAGIALRGTQGERAAWRTRPAPLLSAERMRAGEGGELLFALEAHFSPLDGEVAPRPYVYAVSARGLTARWRGSGLAWPLADAIVLPSGLVCALHDGRSFVAGTEAAVGGAEEPRAARVALYRWNGFGFSAAEDPDSRAACAAAFEVPAAARTGPAMEPHG